MVSVSRRKLLFALSGSMAVLALVVSLAGIARIDMYRPFTPDELMPGAMSQDIVSAAAALCVLACLLAIARGSSTAWLVWLGFVGYLFYAYAIYSFERRYTGFFLCYVAIVGLAIYSAIIFFRTADFGIFKSDEYLARPVPRRTAAVFLLILAVMFLATWLGLVIPAIASGEPPAGNSIIVMDLAFFLPLLVITAFLLLKHRPLGDILAGVLLIKMGVLGLSVFLGEFLRPIFSQGLNAAMIAMFALLGPVSLVFAVVWFKRTGSLEIEKG